VQEDKESRAALRTFDEHFHLMMLIDPSSIQDQLHTAGLLAADQHTSVTTGLVMENLLKHVRSCVELKGAEMFIIFISVLHSDGRYAILGGHLFGKNIIIVCACMCVCMHVHVCLCMHVCMFVHAWLGVSVCVN